MRRFIGGDASLLQKLAGADQVLRLAFVRHCETVLNADGVVDGHSTSHLTPQGRLQAEALARYFRIEQPQFLHAQWIVSPLNRALASAQAIFPEGRFEIADGFREVDVGVMQGRSWRQGIEQGVLSPDHDVSTAFPSGESFASAQARALDELERRLATAQGDLVIVAHGGIIALMIIGLFRMPTAMFPLTVLDNGSCSIIELHCFDGVVSPKIKQINVVPAIERG